MLPVAERLIADTVAVGEVVRLANGMLANRVNAERLRDDASAVDAVKRLADAFVEHVRTHSQQAEPCFVLGGGAKLQPVFEGVRFGIDKSGLLLERFSGIAGVVGNFTEFLACGLKPGCVFLIEDVLTTGGSAVRATQALREQGVGVEFLFALVDRGIGAVRRLRNLGINVTVVTEVRAYNEPR